MADTQLLRNSAIVRNATIAPPQHGAVKTGALPLVQVKMVPGGPQVQNGQQKAVEILPPRDAKSAVAIGGLPMVKVKMANGKAQLDDGHDSPVVIRDAKPAVSAGGLPMIQVRMDGGKPQVQTIPNVQGGPPRIPGAPPALSQPHGTPVARQGYVARGALPTASQGYVAAPASGYVARVAAPIAHRGYVARVAAPAPPQVALPPVPEMSTDELLLCRHAVDKTYLADLVVVDHPTEATEATVSAESLRGREPESAESLLGREPESPTEEPVESDTVKLARATIAKIDDVLVSTAVRAEAEAEAKAAAAAAAEPVAAVPTTQAFAAANSISPAPSAAYVAGRVTRPQQGYTGGVRSQRNSSMAPRRVARAGAPLPPVIVKMDGRQPVVQTAPAPQPEPVAPVAEAVEAPAPPAIAPEISTDAQV